MTIRVARIIGGPRQQKAYGVKDFSLGNRHCPVIYAVALREHSGVTKIGMTLNWINRRKSYECWNLSADAIADQRVFRFFDEFVDLKALEGRIIATLPFAVRHGREWFCGELDEVSREIDKILNATDLSYEIE